MTNEELDNLIRRKEKENRYRQLYPETVSKGKKFTNGAKEVLILGIKDGVREGTKAIVSNIIKNIGDSALKTSSKKKKK